MKSLFLLAFFVISFTSIAQSDTDSLITLKETTVKAFLSEKTAAKTPAPVSIISATQIGSYGADGLLPAFNAIPGVQLEQRSPASYRIALRGSSLRSPYGVRNVKIYWNGLPMTDAGGGTYFNALDVQSIGQIEIAKGPGASLYGAGIGGVLLIESPYAKFQNGKKNEVQVKSSFASFRTQTRSVSYTNANEKSNLFIGYDHSHSDGYREQSASVRDLLTLRESIYASQNYQVNIVGFYSDLHYQTPGGITLAQMKNNPKLARQATPFTPSSVEQNAGIYQKMGMLGISQEIKHSEKWKSNAGIYGQVVDLENPFITNYEKRKQQTIGVRYTSKITFTPKTQFSLGTEFITTKGQYKTFENDGGTPTTPLSDTEAQIGQGFIFGQIEQSLPLNFTINTGLSINAQRYYYATDGNLSLTEPAKVIMMPRLVLSNNISNSSLIYASAASGYSPPTIEEFTAGFNQALAEYAFPVAEKGINYEIGYKLNMPHWQFQFNAYNLQLNNALVRTPLPDDTEIYVNAGKISQKGLEIILSYEHRFLRNGSYLITANADLKDYTFLNYTDGGDTFDNNTLPGIAPSSFNFNSFLNFTPSIFWRVDYRFLSSIYLNNANSVSAPNFHLMHTEVGWQKNFKQWKPKITAGIQNILNKKYSLGNDINAFGQRYYNPAAPRNGFISLSLGYVF